MDIDTSYTDQKEYYNRNKAISVQGSLYKAFINREVQVGINPFTKLETNSYYKLNTLSQNENSTINITINALEEIKAKKILI